MVPVITGVNSRNSNFKSLPSVWGSGGERSGAGVAEAGAQGPLEEEVPSPSAEFVV